MAFALMPLLRRVYSDQPAALRRAVGRHASFFNAHPYLASVAVGALARLEAEGGAEGGRGGTPEGELERFRSALVSPLGTLGDRLVWARWRPLCSLLAVLLAVAGFPWWVAVGAFLVLYNVLHLGIRLWGLNLGWREARGVAAALLDSPLRRLPDRLTIPLAAISGVVLPPLVLAVRGRSGASLHVLIPISLLLAAVGFWRPAIAGRAAAFILVLGTLLFAAFEQISW